MQWAFPQFSLTSLANIFDGSSATIRVSKKFAILICPEILLYPEILFCPEIIICPEIIFCPEILFCPENYFVL